MGDVRKALSLPTDKTLAVWNERAWMGAAKAALRAAKERRVKEDIVVVVVVVYEAEELWCGKVFKVFYAREHQQLHLIINRSYYIP